MNEERRNESEGERPPEQPPPVTVGLLDPEPPEQPASPKVSGMAITSLVLAVLGAVTRVGVIVLGPIGLILGIIALFQTACNPRVKGQAIAIAGTVISAVGILVIPLVWPNLPPGFSGTRDRELEHVCLVNVKQISTAMMMYLQDWNHEYPPAANWNESVAKYMRPNSLGKYGPFVCPVVQGTVPTYALNDRLAGKSETDVVMLPYTVMVYESAPGRNQADGAGLLPNPPRHPGGHILAFADGHVQRVGRSLVATLSFDPTATSVPREPNVAPCPT